MNTHIYLAHRDNNNVRTLPFSIIVADLTNAFVADLTAVVAELTAVVAELDVADLTCRRDGCRRLDLSPT